MSDFLGNLVARTIAQPTLRPRTQSRFEPVSIEEAPLVWPATEREEERGEPAAVPAPPPRLSLSPRAEEVEISAETQAESEPEPRAPEVRTRVIERHRDQPARIERVETIVREEAPRATPPQATHTEKTIDATGERVVRVPERVEVERTVARPHRFDREPPRVIRESQVIERERVRSHERERERRTTIDRPPRIVRGRAEAPPSTPQAEPTIEVSIGRIEVRAVSTPAPQRPATRSTAMTIDDYVAKRKTKERR